MKSLTSCVLVTGLLLFGCSSNPQQLLAQADALQQQQHQQLQQQFPHQQLPDKATTIVFSDEFYVPPLDKSLLQKPSWYSQQVTADIRGLPLKQALQQLLAPLGISIYIADQVAESQLVSLHEQGSVGDVLNWIANAQQLIIKPYDARIEVKSLAVKAFDVSFLAGNTGFMLGDDGANNQSLRNSDKQGVNDSSQYINFSASQLSLWQDLEQSLNLLLSPRGQLTVNRSTTSVLVKDSPAIIQAVADYIAELNQRLTQQVAIDVQVIEVDFNDNQQYSVDWQLLRSADGVSSLTSLAGSSGESTSGVFSFGWQKTMGRRQGSQLFVDALAQQGQVRITHHPRVMTLNNQVARLMVEDETTYLAESSTTNTANVGSQQRLKPGVVTTGFELFLLPKVQQQQVILQLSSSLSALKGIDTVRSGEQLIETPRTSRKSFFLKAMVENQQTLLLSGLQQSHSISDERQGPIPWLTGGQSQQSIKNKETILLLTPQIIGAQH